MPVSLRPQASVQPVSGERRHSGSAPRPIVPHRWTPDHRAAHDVRVVMWVELKTDSVAPNVRAIEEFDGTYLRRDSCPVGPYDLHVVTDSKQTASDRPGDNWSAVTD